MEQLKIDSYSKGYMDGYREGMLDAIRGKSKIIDNTILDLPIKGMRVSARAQSCLVRAGCEKVSDVIALSEEAIWRTRNMGVATAGEIARWLQDQGLEYSAWRRFI